MEFTTTDLSPKNRCNTMENLGDTKLEYKWTQCGSSLEIDGI